MIGTTTKRSLKRCEMAKLIWVCPLLSTLTIVIMLFLGPILHIEDLFYLFVYSLIVVFVISFVGVITSFISLYRSKRFLIGIIALLCNIIVPIGYLTWFSNGVGGM